MEMLGRRALWEVGLNYGHGTGHGVGNYFGVHECMCYFCFKINAMTGDRMKQKSPTLEYNYKYKI